MIGTLDPTDKKVTVIGAGIAGLLAAYQLDKAGWEVTLLEASSRAGGLIRTKITPFGMAESAAHSFLASPKVLELCTDLNVPLVSVKKTGRSKYILRDGKFRRMPLGLVEIFLTICRLFKSNLKSGQTAETFSAQLNLQTLADWAKLHLGDSALDYLLNPFVRGIYGSEPEDLCISAVFPSLVCAPGESLFKTLFSIRRERSGRKSKNKMMAPKEGMDSLTKAIEHHLEKRLGHRFQKGVQIKEIPMTSNVVICTPAHESAKLLAQTDPSLSESLRQIPYTSLISTTVFIPKTDNRPHGVGILIPRKEQRKILGILFNSDAFEGRVNNEHVKNTESFTVIMRNPSNLSSENIHSSLFDPRTIIEFELKSLLGVQASPLHFEINHWSQAIPQYGPALLQAWNQAKAGWCSQPGRVLFGNYTGEVSLRGMIEKSFLLSMLF